MKPSSAARLGTCTRTARRRFKAKGRNDGGKTIVMGILERASKGKQKRVRTSILNDRKKASMQPEVAAHIEPGSTVYSDEWASNWRMDDVFEHGVVNHLQEYVSGNVHTNGIENFWSLLKRGVGGTYVAVEPFHLFRYVDEQAFRFNNRLHVDGEVVSDSERFSRLCKQIIGKRLTYAELIGTGAGKAGSFLSVRLSARGAGNGRLLRLGAALTRIERGFFLVLRFAAENFRAGHGEHFTY